MKVSVIIPIYNAEIYLPRLFGALEAQEYKDFEVILVDDGSTDKSYLLCKRYKNAHDNVVLVSKQNGGSASARNEGLRIARGDYISFIDADDWVDSSFLRKLVELLEKEKADIVVCNYIISSTDDVNLGSDTQNGKILELNNKEALKRFCQRKTYLSMAVLWNKLYKKELFAGIAFPEGRYIDDEYVIYKVLYRANKVVYSDDRLYCYYMSENSQMRSTTTLKIYDKCEMIEEQKAFFERMGNVELLELFLFRYYAVVMDLIYMLTEDFPEEMKKMQELYGKRRGYWRVIISIYVPLQDKLSLLMRRFAPKLFWKIKTGKK